MARVAFIGSEGAGKSTLVANFARFLRKRDHRVALVNLDPLAKRCAYAPDVDARASAKKIPNAARLSLERLLLLLSDDAGLQQAIARLERDHDAVFLDAAGGADAFVTAGAGAFLRAFSDAAVHVADAHAFPLQEYGALRAFAALESTAVGVPVLAVVNKTDAFAKRFSTASLHAAPAIPWGQNEPVVEVSAVDQAGFDELYKEFRKRAWV